MLTFVIKQESSKGKTEDNFLTSRFEIMLFLYWLAKN
jgi:hypothetical protein